MKIATSALLSAVASTSLISGAFAASIGVNFSGGDFGTPAPLAATDTAGVVPQQNWNNEGGHSGSLAALVDSSGGAVSTTVTWSSGNTWANGDQSLGGANNALLSNYLDGGSGGPATVSLANVPYAFYDVYIYTQRDGVATSDYNVDGVTKTVQVAGSGFYNANGFVLDTATTTGDYLVFHGLSNAAPVLISSQVNFRSPIDAIQIVSVPEPASIGLLGITGLGVLARRRRA